MQEKSAKETVAQGAKITQLSGRVSQSVREEFYRLQEEGGYETFSLFMEALLERYSNPLKINQENEAEIKRLLDENIRLENDIKAARASLDTKGGDISKLQLDFDDLQRQFNEKCAELETVNSKVDEYRGLEHKMDGHILVPVNDLDMRCLEWLAARENKMRKREDITPAVFFQFAVREMLIKGNKFAIDSVPDSVIEKFKKEISNGQ